MDITLTPAEEAMFTDLIEGVETVTDSFHRFLSPFVAKHADARLNRLADAYRALTPDLQLEALAVLKAWQDSKNIR